MVPGIDPKVDYAFKRLFGRETNRALAIHLLNAVLEPPPRERVIDLELLNPFNDKDRLDDKLSILDVKARDQSGRQFNVEMQLLANQYFRQRVPYYWARLHQAQLSEGDAYHRLRPTLSICFMNSPLFPEVPTHHLVFELRDRAHHELVFSGDLAMHILELPKFTKSPAELATPLDVWLYFLRHGERLDAQALPPALAAVAEVQRAMGELLMITQSDLERERYEARLKMQRDISTALAAAREEGLEQGLEQGRREGWVRQIHLGQRVLGRALTPAEQLLALPSAELERLAQQLEADLTRAKPPSG
jgi:predicted transposase/invertase (TIGR01784 family)